MTDSPDNRKPERSLKPRRTGRRETIVAGKKYILRVFLGRDAAGKRHYHSEVFHGTAGQAEDRIREIIRRHRAGEPINANADTFGAFIDEGIESKRLSVTESSLETYKRVIEFRIRPAFGNKMLSRVTADDVQRFYSKLHADGMNRSSIHFVHVALVMIFKLAVKPKKLMGSPLAAVEIPKEWADAEDEEKKRDMTPEQVARFLEAAQGSRFENMFNLAFHFGLRPSELLALRWADFDPQARTLRVSQNIVFRKAGDFYFKKPKTKSSKRTLPLTGAMVEVLSRQRKSQLEERLRAGKLRQDRDLIFANSTADPHSWWDLYNECKRILKAAGLPEYFSPKTARHTMATLLIADGTNPKAVQERMGHSKITTTLQQYTHVSPGMQADVSEDIERLLKGKK